MKTLLLSLIAVLVLLQPSSVVAESWLGKSSRSLEDLDPVFRGKVQRVLDRLRRQGYQPEIMSTYRSARRQDLIFELSQVARWLGRKPWTQARGGQSCHNSVDAQGQPAALAVDILDEQRQSGDDSAKFYHALGKAAAAQSLGWGGRWKRSNPYWKRKGLGWDPGHLQSWRCRN